jgi:NodT family efflux transporter outer membrane factor (OMF) lipoprotein
MANSAARLLSASVSLVSCFSLLTACAVGPDFHIPAAPDVSRYTREPLATSTSATDAPTGGAQRFASGRDIPLEWWTLFRSPGLNALMAQALQNNPTLQSTLSTLRATKEAVYAQEGHYFPLVQGNFNPTRQLTASSISPVLASSANPFDLYTAQVQVSYTFDVWGLNRRTVESLQALADNQRFQFEAAYLTLTSSVALAAINEASLRGQIDATNEEIVLNKKMLDILRQQFQTGYASRNDVALQEAALAQVEATLPPLRKALQQNRDLLTALVGAYSSQEPSEIFKLDQLHLPDVLPVSLPSQLIEQRPDVRAAEEQLHSASALIGVATANMLPNFTIDGNAGYMNTVLAGLISPANAFWLISGNATQTLFDAGTLWHTLRGARATYDAAAWSYRSTVVSAVQNVADSLRAVQNDANELKAARDFERAAKISYDLAQQQMQTGYANILVLLTAQQTYLQAVLQVVQARAARLSDTAALFQALGGGWWNRTAAPTEKILDVSTDHAATLVDRTGPPAAAASVIVKSGTPQ